MTELAQAVKIAIIGATPVPGRRVDFSDDIVEFDQDGRQMYLTLGVESAKLVIQEYGDPETLRDDQWESIARAWQAEAKPVPQ